MRARLATKKLKQLLSPAVQVALEIGVAPLHAAELPPLDEPPLLEVPALPPLLEVPALPPLLEVPALPPLLEVPALPPLLEVVPPAPATPVVPLVLVVEPPVLGAPAEGDVPADPPLASGPESPPLHPAASSITTAQPLTNATALVAVQILPFKDLMEFYKAS
jgi:hypothetical protein